MKVPVSWLREYVDFDLPVEELARRLVFTSCEVDRVVHRGVPDENGNLGRFLVGKVLEAEKHPNADRLQLTKVDVGEAEPRSIVCGAWNFGAGATVAVALPGAMLPNGLTLERRKVRGEVSDGMILAEDEVDLGTDHAGIMLLDAEHEPGTPLADVLPLVDTVLEIETGYNRPDLTSVYGIAREVAALLDLSLAAMPGVQDPRPVPNDEPVDIRIDDLERCPRYIGRLFRDVRVGDSPRVAEGAPARRRHAADLERRRRDELRDARARQPAARVRPREARRGADRRAPRSARASRSARSTAASAR